MSDLPELKTLRGHSAYCGVCWEPVFRLWVADEAPDYERCGIGDYTAQSCPNAVGAAQMAALSAKAREAGMTFTQYLTSLASSKMKQGLAPK